MHPILTGLIALALNILVWIALASAVEALRRRGIDPVGRIAAFLSPAPTAAAGATVVQ